MRAVLLFREEHTEKVTDLLTEYSITFSVERPGLFFLQVDNKVTNSTNPELRYIVNLVRTAGFLCRITQMYE